MLKLSLVMPVYNKSHLTQEAILNILDVCRNIDYELLVIDDWSTDDTWEIVASLYNQSEGKIKYYKFEENVGVTVAWNQWVKYAQWEYISVINNDVIFPQEFFEKIIDGFDDDENIGIVNPRFREWDRLQPSPLMYYGNHICWHCFTFKKENKDKFFPIDERMRIFGNDNWLWFHIKDLGFRQKVKHDAICHHLKSQTAFYVPNVDRPVFFKIADEKWWDVVDVYPLPEDDLQEDFIFDC